MKPEFVGDLLSHLVLEMIGSQCDGNTLTPINHSASQTITFGDSSATYPQDLNTS